MQSTKTPTDFIPQLNQIAIDEADGLFISQKKTRCTGALFVDTAEKTHRAEMQREK